MCEEADGGKSVQWSMDNSAEDVSCNSAKSAILVIAFAVVKQVRTLTWLHGRFLRLPESILPDSADRASAGVYGVTRKSRGKSTGIHWTGIHCASFDP